MGQSQDGDRAVPCRGGGSLPHPHAALPSPGTPGAFPPIVRWRQGHGFLPVTSPAVTLRFQGRWAPGNKARTHQAAFTGGGTDRSPQAQRDRNQAALQAGKWESAPAASGDNRNFGNDSKRRRISPPSAAGLGNIRLSVGFVGAVLLPLLPPARSGRGAGNQNPPQPLQTKPQTTRSTLSPGSAQQLEAQTGSWGGSCSPRRDLGLGRARSPAGSTGALGPRSMGRWQRAKSEFSHLQ